MQVAKIAGFLGAAGREVGRVEIQDEWTAFE
jgi:hypothetical protein